MKNIKETKLLKEGENTEVLGLITKVSIRPTKRGKNYADLLLEDKSGTISIKKWEVTSLDEEVLKNGNVILVSGTINEYNGQKQVIANSVGKRDLDPAEFKTSVLPSLGKTQEDCLAFLHEIEDESVKNLCLSILDDERWLKWPAAQAVHHAEEGGLLVHTTEVMRKAVALANAERYGELNKDLVIAGAFLHDYGKLLELEPDENGAGKYTKYSLLGHVYMSAARVAQAVYSGEIDEDTGLLLQHIVLSHHGKLEYGSPVLPMIREAQIVAMADDADAKMNAMANELTKVDPGQLSERPVFATGAKVYCKE